MSRVRLTTLFVLLAATGLVAACGRGPEQAKANDSETRVEPRSTPASSPFENSPPAVQLVAKGAADPINAPTTDKIEAKETPRRTPELKEVQRAIERVFEKVAAPDGTLRPSLVVGDFNGDGSEDLAVAVKPGDDAFPQINNELANWMLEDPK